jgi:type IV pilus assembly protein PilW
VKRKHRGLTLIELLVSIVLSLLVIDAAISLLLANRNVGNTTSALSAVSDNGRVALNFIGQAVRSGGYMACNATNDLHQITNGTRQISILTAGASPVRQNYIFAFGGYEAVNTAPTQALAVAAPPIVADGNPNDWIGGLDALLANRVTKGSDVLVVRESVAQVAPIYTTNNYLTGTGQVTLAVNNVGTLFAGQYAVISNCLYSTAFQVGAVGANTIGTAGAADLFGGDLRWSYGFPATITPMDMSVYYVGPGRDGDSSLWVYDEQLNSFQEEVPDVENMQVLYGIAPITPNLVTQYVTADQVANFNQVVSIKVALLVASPPGVASVQTPIAAQPFSVLYATVTPPLDARLRKVFETTITVRNAAHQGSS